MPIQLWEVMDLFMYCMYVRKQNKKIRSISDALSSFWEAMEAMCVRMI